MGLVKTLAAKRSGSSQGVLCEADVVLWLQTTTINCLTGVIPASGGDALVYGEALSSSGGMDRIRSMMGVCPQFDVLWSELTGIEHLTIYGNIKVPAKPHSEYAEIHNSSHLL